LRRQGKEPYCKVDAGKDAGLRPGIMDSRGDDMGLLEIENGRTKRQQADPYRDTEQIGRMNQLRRGGEGATTYPLLAGTRRVFRISAALKLVNSQYR
jgi:hypothetical protein